MVTDVFSKLFGVVLAFILCVLAPYSISATVQDRVARFGMIDEMTMFMDDVADTRQITDSALEDFQLGVSSYGQLVKITINRYAKTVDPDPVTGGTYTTYVYADNNKKYNQGDHIQVEVQTIGYTGTQKLMMSTVGIFVKPFDCTLSRRVR
jgi:hypothetical protein